MTKNEIIDDYYMGLPPHTCCDCEFAKTMRADCGWVFLGCYRDPYVGRWVGEIKDCPKKFYENTMKDALDERKENP